MHQPLRALLARTLTLVPALSVLACDQPVTDSDEPVPLPPICEEPEDVACVDDMVLDLGLQSDKVSEGTVETTVEGDDFVTRVDASAGGLRAAPDRPFVYIRFTEDGAEKVEIDDEAALGDMGWHIAAKRYVIRLNGGSSGPSCVGAMPLLEADYDSVNEVPDGARFFQDDFYTDDCTFINDSSGLPGSPQVAMASWWTYPGCVATALHPFVIQLDDGRAVKLQVLAYYDEGQDECNETGTMGSGSARFVWRWRFLPSAP